MQFPSGDKPFVIRTDFSSDTAWESFCEALGQPVGDFQADFQFVSDEAFDGATLEQLVTIASMVEAGFIVIADSASMKGAELTALAVDLLDNPGRTFRFVPSIAWSVENNLSLGNMDFSEFADNATANGVFRGF